MFGTTLTQYCLWWSVWGGEETKSRQREWQRRGLKLADGNAMTKNLVAGGACDLGFTDTDDYFGALDAGRPVAGLPVRVEGKTICIPNTVAMVKGSTHTEAAQSLIDFLLSAETEIALARSASRQIPLGEVDEAQLPAEVRPLRKWANESADLRPLISVRNDVLNWLRGEYVP
ncbi:MAG: extracellular solute-binding protein [Planctomycetota bacterium]|nr:extracellular solute-binding protein [Planctomycetota bacterium]